MPAKRDVKQVSHGRCTPRFYTRRAPKLITNVRKGSVVLTAFSSICQTNVGDLGPFRFRNSTHPTAGRERELGEASGQEWANPTNVGPRLEGKTLIK